MAVEFSEVRPMYNVYHIEFVLNDSILCVTVRSLAPSRLAHCHALWQSPDVLSHSSL